MLTPSKTLSPSTLRGGLRLAVCDDPTPFAEGAWYEADAVGAGLDVRFPPGTLADATHLAFDLLVEGRNSVVFVLRLQEGAAGPVFTHTYFVLNGVGARVRLPLSTTNQNRWLLQREGAWLKPMVGGDRVDPALVDRLWISVERKSAETARFFQTAVRVHTGEPPRLDAPPLPHGPVIDALGQSTRRDWPGKVRTEAQLVATLRRQRQDAATAAWPAAWTAWGGCRDVAFKATGFFRVEKTDARYWLVAPNGSAFWSAGIDCWRSGNFSTPLSGLRNAFAALPEDHGPMASAWNGGESRRPGDSSVCFHTANLVRAFGDDWHRAWEELASGGLRQIGFNTVANWSDWQTASRLRLPYVRPLHLEGSRSPCVFRDFPDVFDEHAMAVAAAALARQLESTRSDPAMIGYFLGNEPTWGFASQTPAEGMLTITPACRTREALAEWLRNRHRDDVALATAWGMPGATFARLRQGCWTEAFSTTARTELADFSTVMVARLYDTFSRACKAVDPHHLNLGARYYTVPPAWALAGMTSFDVFSINCYRQEVPADLGERLVKPTGRPVLIGEWHFGALDVGLPSSGIGHVPTQADRGKAFRRYTELAASQPWCLGVHYFTFYDQAASGRFDGENYNIGFFDVCNQPYTPLVDAARKTHERLYDVARGKASPYDEAPPYLPLLFC